MRQIERASQIFETVLIRVDQNNSSSIPNGAWSALAMYTPLSANGGPSSATTVTWYGSHSSIGPFYPVTLPDGTTAQTAVSGGNVYCLPTELFAVRFLRGQAPVAFNCTIMAKS